MMGQQPQTTEQQQHQEQQPQTPPQMEEDDIAMGQQPQTAEHRQRQEQHGTAATTAAMPAIPAADISSASAAADQPARATTAWGHPCTAQQAPSEAAPPLHPQLGGEVWHLWPMPRTTSAARHADRSAGRHEGRWERRHLPPATSSRVSPDRPRPTAGLPRWGHGGAVALPPHRYISGAHHDGSSSWSLEYESSPPEKPAHEI